MKPVINEYVRELSHPGYDAAQRNAFVAAKVVGVQESIEPRGLVCAHALDQGPCD